MKKFNIKDHTYYMNQVLTLASSSGQDIPVAALIVKEHNIIASSINKKEKLNDPTAHAEMLVIKEACKNLNRWRLDDVILYTNLEPCPMCAAAILYSRIPVVVFGAYDKLYGAFGSAIDLGNFSRISSPQIIGGIEEEKATALLKLYFDKMRT